MSLNCKFIINRNNYGYIYAEKYVTGDESKYFLYSDGKVSTLSADCFQDVFANDKKMSISDFLTTVVTGVLYAKVQDENVDFIYHKVSDLQERMKIKDIRNPYIKGGNRDLYKVIDEYNKFILREINYIEHDEIDHEAEYMRLVRQEL